MSKDSERLRIPRDGQYSLSSMALPSMLLPNASQGDLPLTPEQRRAQLADIISRALEIVQDVDLDQDEEDDNRRRQLDRRDRS